MTQEMLHIILTLALTKLIELPPAQLRSYEPWLTRKHIAYCLDHVHDFKVEDDADIAARLLIREAARVLAQEDTHA